MTRFVCFMLKSGYSKKPGTFLNILKHYKGPKNYPYLPHGSDFSLDPPPPPSISLEIPVKPYAFTYSFGPLRTPHPPGISNPFCGGSMDIFWNYTLSQNSQKIQNNGLPCLLVFCHAVFLASGHFSMIPASLSTFWPVLTPFSQTCIRRFMTQLRRGKLKDCTKKMHK